MIGNCILTNLHSDYSFFTFLYNASHLLIESTNSYLRFCIDGCLCGNTSHWHNAAFNVLYVGTKEWRVTPPKYKGMTGMQPMNTAKQLDESYTLRCTQHEGDIIYVPTHWGHMTMNHGFTIGAAIIIPEAKYKKSRVVGKLKKSFAHHQQETIPFLFVNINKTGGSIIVEMLNTHCNNKYIKERWGDNHQSIHSTSLSYTDHKANHLKPALLNLMWMKVIACK